ncbi:phosphoribosylformylglycinamidine cyclo-ligase [bacterium]|nr:MAG: phosphoribosylformylglycinamidine cyclo-ligase [bacterium]
MKKLTYKNSGVDIKESANFKNRLKFLARRSFRPEVLKDIGGFGSFFRFAKEKYRDPILVSSADGVGTKLKIAILANKHDTVGIDAVAMNVNDILCVGAEPLFFLDYIAFSKLSSETLFAVVKGINNGCIQSGCSLIGGETAQMPGMYKHGEYDLAGFCVGVVEKSKIIDGSGIGPADLVIGLESNGLHSNGFSLVRKVLSENELRRMNKELLRPTRVYVKPILSLLRSVVSRQSTAIRGIAHITGGAFYDKIARILPDNLKVVISRNSWVVPKIFRLIQNKGDIAETEMYHTFNMGIGMVLIVKADSAGALISQLSEEGLKSWVIGQILRGAKAVEIV